MGDYEAEDDFGGGDVGGGEEEDEIAEVCATSTRRLGNKGNEKKNRDAQIWGRN